MYCNVVKIMSKTISTLNTNFGITNLSLILESTVAIKNSTGTHTNLNAVIPIKNVNARQLTKPIISGA